jgi:cytochrome c553
MGGPGPEGVAPRLAGQFAQYLEARMGAFSRGEIASAATMTAMMKALDADERAKLAKYLSGL